MEASLHTESSAEKSIPATVLGLAGKARELREKVLQAKAALDETFEQRAREARHAIRRGRCAAEDLVDQTTLRIHQKPLQSVSGAFACGLMFGGTLLYAVGRIRQQSSEDWPELAKVGADLSCRIGRVLERLSRRGAALAVA